MATEHNGRAEHVAPLSGVGIAKRGGGSPDKGPKLTEAALCLTARRPPIESTDMGAPGAAGGRTTAREAVAPPGGALFCDRIGAGDQPRVASERDVVEQPL